DCTPRVCRQASCDNGVCTYQVVADGTSCQGGKCCSGECTNPLADPNNCSGCGRVCGAGSDRCGLGECRCGPTAACPLTQTCEPPGVCTCPGGLEVCGADCIPAGSCCPRCAAGQKCCGAYCISNNACCTVPDAAIPTCP